MAEAALARAAAPAELHADPLWRAIEVLSDVHLSPAMPATFEAWAAHLRNTDADAVLLLGDLFEAWVGDDAAQDDGFESCCLEVIRRASMQRRVAFMPGNRDFLLGDAALADSGMVRLADPTTLVAFGRRVLLTHGDAWCLADQDYQRFRADVRRAEWQRTFLGKPLDERRTLVRQMRDASEEHHRAKPQAASADVDRHLAIRMLQTARAETLVHGHTHRPSHDLLAPCLERYVTSDWNFEHGASRGDVLRITATGVERVAPVTSP